MTSTVTSSVALPLEPSAEPSSLFKIIDLLPNAYHCRDHMLLAGLILSAIVIVFRMWNEGRGKELLTDARTPWLTFAVSAVSGAAVGLEQHQTLESILGVSFVCGLIAVGGWATFEDMIEQTILYFVRPPNGKPGGSGGTTKTPEPNTKPDTPAKLPDKPPGASGASMVAGEDDSGRFIKISGSIDICPRCLGPIGYYTGLCRACRYTSPTTLHAYAETVSKAEEASAESLR